jgi:hypothetical protein
MDLPLPVDDADVRYFCEPLSNSFFVDLSIVEMVPIFLINYKVP